MNFRACNRRVRLATQLSLSLILVSRAADQITSVVKLLATPNPVVQGQNDTLTAGVNWTNTASPTGAITLSDTCGSSTTVLGTIALGSANSATPGAGTLQVSSFPCLGENQIVALYSGDSNYTPGTSQPLVETVLAQFTPTSINLISSVNPATVGQSVALTAQLSYTLTSNSHATGSVTFRDANAGAVLGTGAVQTSGTGAEVVTSASMTTSSLAAGSYAVQAVYSGDNIYASATSPVLNEVIRQSQQSGLWFVPVTPCRVADTRDGPSGPVIGQNSTTFSMTQSPCGIPATAQAYALNATVVPRGPLRYLTVWPAGSTQPLASTLNSPDGRIKANAAIVDSGNGAGVNVFASDTTDVVLDINGYFVPASTASALTFYPVTPCRIADTRDSNGPLGGPYLTGGQTRDLPILTSSCKIPVTAQAYSLNFTAVPRGPLRFMTVWPAGQSQPVVSTLNAPTATTTANAAIIPAGGAGDIDVFATDDTDLVVDVNGYFAAPGSGGLSYNSVNPCRALDTRETGSALDGTMTVNLTGSVCAVPSEAQAFVLNATVVPNGPLEYLTLWPHGQSRPVVSTLNASDSQITSNMAIVPSASGSIDALSVGSTNLILDISGYFAP